MQVDDLLTAATERTGLTDFGDDSSRERLDRLVASINAEASGQHVSFVIETEDGTTHDMRGETMMSTSMVLPKDLGGSLQLQQAIRRYTWDDEMGLGMLERSIAPESPEVAHRRARN